ncbi:hypothetical protein L1987_41777 [Smallanthus sonchifolius]|uniref:Uncharacterized protein n=1 Tax=Smallanthus sonchifolius TaxID=185202 RepID=A0ACB9GV77_9ASTR|nr:hypothetical protein L1987_41777 [Smallanthus sonchifolius]
MSSTRRAWMVAGTVGLVEALKDQGFARWNYTIRAIHHHAKANLRQSNERGKGKYCLIRDKGGEFVGSSDSSSTITCKLQHTFASINKFNSRSMSSTSRAWMVAGTVGLVEALKDQGFARWNYTIRAIHHHAKANLRSVSQTKKLSSPAAMASGRGIEEKAKQSEESLRKVMYLSCWGPN